MAGRGRSPKQEPPGAGRVRPRVEGQGLGAFCPLLSHRLSSLEEDGGRALRELPTGVKWFLLNKLFQMRPAEIARMEGVKNPHGVRGMIIRVSDQLRCGEISLFEKDPEEAEAAKVKLDARRAQRRARYAKNKDKINAKRRKAYVLKKIGTCQQLREPADKEIRTRFIENKPEDLLIT